MSWISASSRTSHAFGAPELSLSAKVWQISRLFVVLVLALGAVGVMGQYSAANGHMEPWASRHAMRFGVCFIAMIGIALIDIRFLARMAYPIYFANLLLLAGVEAYGKIGGLGAQRWINLGFVQLQPSELMKIALILGLARWFHDATLEDVRRPTYLLAPLAMILVPVGLVLAQPNLGTGLMLLMVGGALFFLVGVRLWKFAILILLGLGAVPLVWRFMKDYQKRRVTTFLDPSTDPLGAGYHITQSKIALGSGGLWGKGFLLGSQSHLNFLPEKQTDFIFTLLCEEWGFWGGIGLLTLFAMVVAYGIFVGLRSRNQFGRVLALGLSVNLFLYVFINTAMVMGLIPVVGVPLPLISFGGTSMMSVMIGFGLILSVLVHRDSRMRNGEI